jgi:hypothetical protein
VRAKTADRSRGLDVTVDLPDLVLVAVFTIPHVDSSAPIMSPRSVEADPVDVLDSSCGFIKAPLLICMAIAWERVQLSIPCAPLRCRQTEAIMYGLDFSIFRSEDPLLVPVASIAGPHVNLIFIVGIETKSIAWFDLYEVLRLDF